MPFYAVPFPFLPKTSGVKVPASKNLLGRVFHNRTRENAYYLCVFNLLNPAQGNKAGVEGVLRMIRKELIAGTVNW
jgi:hypothetical protein